MTREVQIDEYPLFLDHNFRNSFKESFLQNCQKISFYEQDICPHCCIGIDMARARQQDFLDIASENQPAFNVISVYQCPYCHRGFVVIHHLERKSIEMSEKFFYIEASQSVYPIATPNLTIDHEIHKISPRFYETYNQCLMAKASGLNELYGMGYRKALEYLVKDFAISENSKEKKKIESMSLHSCIETYFKNSDAKTALTAAKWLGNNETHYVNDNDEGDIVLLENLIQDTLDYIRREFRNKKAILINANKGKKNILGMFGKK